MTDHTLMNEDKVSEHIENMDGYCVECGAITHGGVEPDAAGYTCEECGEKKVIGFESAVLYEWIIPSSEKYPMLNQYKKE